MKNELREKAAKLFYEKQGKPFDSDWKDLEPCEKQAFLIEIDLILSPEFLKLLLPMYEIDEKSVIHAMSSQLMNGTSAINLDTMFKECNAIKVRSEDEKT